MSVVKMTLTSVLGGMGARFKCRDASTLAVACRQQQRHGGTGAWACGQPKWHFGRELSHL